MTSPVSRIAQLTATFASLCLTGSMIARAAEPPRTEASQRRLQWKPAWRRVGVPEYVTTGVAGAGILALRLVESADRGLWVSPILLDDWTRDSLRIDAREGRRIAAAWSDGLDVVAMGHVLLVDNLAVAAIGDSNPDVAWQLFVINLQSYALSNVLNRATKLLTRRARPYVRPCRANPEYDEDCGSETAYESFYSGHSTNTATSAGLMCAHHLNLDLYGGGWPDIATCAGAVAFTLATGALRIASDKHWASDVMVGHASGLLIGYMLPELLYYRQDRAGVASAEALARTTWIPLPRSGGFEINFIGIF